MDKDIQILLGSKKNINSINVDNFDKVLLSNKKSEIIEYNINDIVNESKVFFDERENNQTYRIYGRIDYISLLNGINFNYSTIADYLSVSNGTDVKNIMNSFQFYLVKPSTGYTNVIYHGERTNKYIRFFEVISNLNNFEIYPAAFSKNIYDEQIYAFNFNIDFNVEYEYDSFGFPLTELFLYAKYVPTNSLGSVGFTMQEKLFRTQFLQDDTVNKYLLGTGSNPPNELNIGDRLYGDLLEYSKNIFYQNQYKEQIYYIETTYKKDNEIKPILWKYNPFISLKLRYFNDSLYVVNTGTTSYNEKISIPEYATKIDDNGNYVWKNILPQGYYDPITGLGVNYPFLNGKRYLFANITFDVTPDLTDSNTLEMFDNIWFSRNKTELYKSVTNLNDINNPCK